MPRIRSAIVVAGFAVLSVVSLSTASIAQDPPVQLASVPEAIVPVPPSNQLLVRAIDPKLDPAVVEYIAQNAVGISFAVASRPDLERLTPTEIAIRLCGSVQPGYLSRIKLSPDRPVGVELYDVEWPACLYVAPSDTAREYVVKDGETLSGIWQRFVGKGYATKMIWRARLSSINAYARKPEDLKEAAVVNLPVTAPTLVIPTGKAADFKQGLRDLALPGQQQISVAAATTPGELILSLGQGAGTIAGSDDDCVPSTSPPRDAVLAAYGEALINAPRVFNVRSIVIDNGFFGVDCGSSACPAADHYYSQAFPRGIFDPTLYRNAFGVGPVVSPGVGPVNYLNTRADGNAFAPSDIDEVSGHGTHVASLAIGGETLGTNADAVLKEQGRYWLTLTIFNVANGGRNLIPGTETMVWTRLDEAIGNNAKIVNMSLIFNRNLDPSTPGSIEKAVKDRAGVLFVVAAGNRVGNLNQSLPLPAALGGMKGAANVITVAALDGNDSLTGFSGWGEKVDLAAPGCKVRGRLSAERPADLASGTSQAAPNVTFAAALLYHVWDVTPVQIKNRLIYAGDEQLCAKVGTISRCIGSATRLNVWKALLLDYDVVRTGGATYLGSFDLSGELTCDDGTTITGTRLRSFRKVEAPGRYRIFYADSPTAPLAQCMGQWLASSDGAQPSASLRQAGRWTGVAIDRSIRTWPPATTDIEEVVFHAR